MKILNAKKILVAVDIFTDALAVEQKLFDCLAHVTQDDAEIYPICITSDIPIEGHHPFMEKELRVRMSRHILGQNVKPPRVIASQILCLGSRSDRVKALLEYAENEKFELIAAYTHTIDGHNDFIMGSFIEPLIYNSNIPLLLVNPINYKIESVKKIFIPIGSQDAEVEHYAELFESGMFSDCEVHFYHQIYDHEHFVLDKLESIRLHHQKLIAEEKERLENKFAKLSRFEGEMCQHLEFHICVSSKKDRMAVEEHIDELSPDLVLITRIVTRKPWHFFHSGFAKFILRNSKAPVLLFPIKEKKVDN